MVMFSRSSKTGEKTLGSLERSLAALGGPLSTEQNSDKDFIGRYGLNLLYAPSEPLVDLVFVHGLRGGSRKTWCKTTDPLSYWPKEWLPRDPEFQHVRIHSFGYNSDWGNKEESVLNLLDFGKSLLAEMMNSPEIERDGETPIVLVGHSMGGLVIKQTYILASRDESAKPLANRVLGMVFLATPHRGADLASTLHYVLKASMVHGEKPFLADLERNSIAIASINDEFRHYSSSLWLSSFYETKKTTLGYKSVLVVEKASAIMGYQNEESAALEATHRNVCKFDSPSDPNFVTLRNSLATMIRKILHKVTSTRREQRRTQILDLQNFLDIFETPEDDLASLDDAKLDGSCQWFSDRKSFLSWRNSIPCYKPYYWLKGQQAGGKSILAAYIIKNLEETNADHSYYFFKHNDKKKISLSSCLRSLAYQMAIADLRIAQRLLILKADNVMFDKNNELVIWRKLFMNGIFEISQERTHFWVIDGLDECTSQHSILCLLAKGTNGFPLRVFMTSRPTSDISRDVLQLKDAVYTDEMTISDTRIDIEGYVQAYTTQLPLQSPTSRKSIVDTILEKSCGSFLWVVLVLEEMRSAFSIADIERIMEEVPTGMDPLYERALVSISSETRGKKLIQAILQWTVCAVRPMTLEELEQALRLDTGEVVLDLRRLITSTCWQFIKIDKSSKVSVLHETVRAFLLREDLQSDFAIDRRSVHGRIADVCLEYLSSNEMKPPQNQKLLHLYRAKLSSRSAFVKYACEYFSLHLRRSHAEDTQRFLRLFNFLEKNVSSWIEYVARTGNLQPLIQTAKDMRGFIQARAKYYSPLGKQVQLVESWETDLVRLVSQFGKNLVQSPTAIFWLLSPFCPSKTAIGTLSHSSARGLVIKGLKGSSWSDRISCIQYRDIQARAVNCGVGTFAVGLSDKSIKIYVQSTCQEQQNLRSSQPAKLLAHSNSGKSLAAASIHFLTFFSLDSGKQLWQIRLPQECLSILFDDKDEIIWLVTKGGDLSSLSVQNGSCLTSTLLSDDSAHGIEAAFRRIFVAAAFALDLNLVAVVQRGRPVSLYDMEQGTLLGFCEWNVVESDGIDHAHMWIRDFFFRPNLESSVLVVLYHEGQLVLFDPYELTAQKYVQIDAHVMACSPDGHTLVTGNDTGTIQVYDFETLTMIYKLVACDYSIKSLTFSNDGLRFIDIRGSQCNVWQPSLLVREKSGENDSVSDTIAGNPSVIGIEILENISEITSLACHPSGEYILCGKDDGAVALYDTMTGKEVHILYRHAHGISVHLLACGNSNLVVSADASSRCMAWRIAADGKSWSAKGPLLDIRFPDSPIRQVLLGTETELLLVHTAGADLVYEIESGHQISSQVSGVEARRWLNHPRDPSKLILIRGTQVAICRWVELSRSINSMNLKWGITTEILVKDAAPCSSGDMFYIDYAGPKTTHSAAEVLVLSTSSFTHDFTKEIRSQLLSDKLAFEIEHIIGWVGTKLLFLDRRFWVCSVDLLKPPSEYYRHFFIPEDWLSLNRSLILKVTSKGDLVFVKKDEIAVIKRWSDFKDAFTL